MIQFRMTKVKCYKKIYSTFYNKEDKMIDKGKRVHSELRNSQSESESVKTHSQPEMRSQRIGRNG